MEKFGIKNHITIPGFAVVELGLSGNELVCFSLIYGFCQDGESEFYGSISYIMSAMNITRKWVFEILKSLIKKDLIIKHDVKVNGVRYCKYTISEKVMKIIHHKDSVENTPPVKKIHGGGVENTRGVVYNVHGGGVENTPNNIINNIDNNIDISIPADDPLAHRWDKFQKWIDTNCPEVQKMKQPITKEQFASLIEKYSVATISEILGEMNNWALLRKKNVSAYQTALNWIKRRDNEKNNKPHGRTTYYDTAGSKADATLGTNFRPSDI